MSSSANYRPFLRSFCHIPPQESFVKLANYLFIKKIAADGRNVYLVKIGLKSLVDGCQDICKDKESNFGWCRQNLDRITDGTTDRTTDWTMDWTTDLITDWITEEKKLLKKKIKLVVRS